jgi:DNA polymerase-3 subunit gamma/tau
MLVINVDPSRLEDPEIAADSERPRLKTIAAQFSAEDLMRAFEVFTKAEYEIRSSAYPRYHLEMALLRWIHLRKLVPLSDLIDGLGPGAASAKSVSPKPPISRPAPASPSQMPAPAARSTAATVKALEARKPAGEPPTATTAGGDPIPNVHAVAASDLKESFLNEVRKSKKFFHGSVVSMAQRIEIVGDRVVFTFAPLHRVLRGQLDQQKPWLETLASQLAGRKMSIASAEGPAPVSSPSQGAASAPAKAAAQAPAAEDKQAALRQQALADPGVQSMLDVFGAEIKEIEEM